MNSSYAAQAVKKELLANLTRMANQTASGQVFLREQIPDRFHYRNHRRIPDVLLLANEGVLYVSSTFKIITVYFRLKSYLIGSYNY